MNLFGKSGFFTVAEDVTGDVVFGAGLAEVDGVGGVEFEHIVMVWDAGTDVAVGCQLRGFCCIEVPSYTSLGVVAVYGKKGEVEGVLVQTIDKAIIQPCVTAVVNRPWTELYYKPQEMMLAFIVGL